MPHLIFAFPGNLYGPLVFKALAPPRPVTGVGGWVRSAGVPELEILVVSKARFEPELGGAGAMYGQEVNVQTDRRQPGREADR